MPIYKNKRTKKNNKRTTRKTASNKNKERRRHYINNNIIFTFASQKNQPENAKITEVQNTFKLFLDIYCKGIRKYTKSFPQLRVDRTQLIKKPNNTNMFYMFIYTMPYNNHPFLVYGNLFKLKYKIIIPFGDKKGQINIGSIGKYIDYFTASEKIAIRTLLNRTIYIRKVNIIENNKYSLLACDKIKMCVRDINKIKKNNKLTASNKEQEMKKINNCYKTKGKYILNTYFNLLEKGKAYEAKYLLEGKGVARGKYDITINKFFNGGRETIGHLKIFISLYELLSDLK